MTEQPNAAPYPLEDNAYSLLDVTDLVFIDPVGTGFSHALGEAEDKEFHGIEEDVKAVGDFIRLWITRNERWNSPKLVGGESYGTTRTAALSSHLQGRGIFPNGLVLVSSILNFQTARFIPGNDLPFILFLPTYAATAWYHGQVDDRPEAIEDFLGHLAVGRVLAGFADQHLVGGTGRKPVGHDRSGGAAAEHRYR